MTRYFGHVGIQPIGDLSHTAKVLGEILGEINFLEDSQHRFDEFPAFIAQVEDAEYALLGIPGPADDLRDEPTKDFELQILPRPQAGGARMDISEQLVAKINADGRIRCWPLK